MTKEKCPEKLLAVYKKVYSSRYAAKILKAAGIVIVLCVAFAYVLCLYKAFNCAVTEGIVFISTTAIPFAAVSAMRILVSAPRPYEVYDLESLTCAQPHYKLGKSFPSRHVFSAFLIGTLAVKYVMPLGICVLILGVALAVARVILGIHFVKDVVCGAIIGIASGMVSLVVL